MLFEICELFTTIFYAFFFRLNDINKEKNRQTVSFFLQQTWICIRDVK